MRRKLTGMIDQPMYFETCLSFMVPIYHSPFVRHQASPPPAAPPALAPASRGNHFGFVGLFVQLGLLPDDALQRRFAGKPVCAGCVPRHLAHGAAPMPSSIRSSR